MTENIIVNQHEKNWLHKAEDRRILKEMSKLEKRFPRYNAVQKIGSGTINGARH